MWNVLKQNDPNNILWKLFRVEVEKVVMPPEKDRLSTKEESKGDKGNEK